MINSALLTANLRAELAAVASDMRQQAEGSMIDGRLRSEWQLMRAASRTSAPYESWKDEQITQISAAWLLGTVFVRFCEDNGIVPEPYLAGPRGQLAQAADRQNGFVADCPDTGARRWILRAFGEVNAFPATASLLNTRHSPLGQIEISDQAATRLISFWRKQRDGEIIHDFTDAELRTGFLAQLYQNLSDDMRIKDALLQTPDFVQQFILNQTLVPAMAHFGLNGLRVIDPACGSGTFLLGTFQLLLDRWRSLDPSASPWVIVGRALASIHGVDKNPISVSIARFRLAIAAMKAGGGTKFANAPLFPLVIATGDSLQHGRGMRPASGRADTVDDFEAAGLLDTASYHVVIGNPPYITVKDKALSDSYRALHPYCTGTYSLTIPFIMRSFDLAVRGDQESSGYIGLITSNSFMRREFGRSLIERFMPTISLTDVIDTSGAFIPGHGTPTVILSGRNHPPLPKPVRVVTGLRGEPEIPQDPARGHVWRSILSGIEHIPYEDHWTRGQVVDRSVLSSFPWNFADETTTRILKHMKAGPMLGSRVARIGYFANTGSDDLFTAPRASFWRMKTEPEALIPVITGSEVRDWTARSEADGTLLPDLGAEPRYSGDFSGHLRRLWPFRTVLRNRRNYSGRSYFEDHRQWYTWHHVTEDLHAHPWSITFPWISTHNHFAILRGKAAPLNSAPVIRLPEAASDSDVIQLTALLNSSLVCFWLKQYSNNKGQPRADQTGTGEPWTLFYEFTGSRLAELPLPPDRWSNDRWSVHAGQLDDLARELSSADPRSLLGPGSTATVAELDMARTQQDKVRARLIGLQEELDWEIYIRYGLLSDSEDVLAPEGLTPGLVAGERAFELLLARRLASGEAESTWFERHNVTPVTELPNHWPARYREVVENRIETIERRKDIGLIERSEFKRRWADPPWAKQERDAIRNWLLDRCEKPALWYETTCEGKLRPRPTTINMLAEGLSEDPAFIEMATRYGGTGAETAKIVEEIIKNQHVPYLAALRYTESGLSKRIRWEETWDQQSEEDANGPIPEIPIPPKYVSSDFVRPDYWRQRGKYDVPNERFISYPSGWIDGELALGWAGWNHAERAYVVMGLAMDHEHSGYDDQSAIPLLAGLFELLPWLRRSRSEAELSSQEGYPAEGFRIYLENELTRRALSSADLAMWRPPIPRRGRPPKAPIPTDDPSK